MDRRRAAPSVTAATLALLGVLVAACAGAAPVSPSFPLSGMDWTLDPPTGWRYSAVSMDASFSHLYGYLGTVGVDPGAICQTTTDGWGCDPRGYTLPPGNVLVTLETIDRLRDPSDVLDAAASGSRVSIGGMSALLTQEEVAPDETRRHWQVPRPAAFGSWVDVTADIRGPDDGTMRRQVEAMMASFRFLPPPAPLPSGPAADRTAVASALGQLRAGQPDAYACFPSEPDTWRPWHVIAMPQTKGSVSVDAMCSTAIERTDLGYWKVVFRMTWDAAPGRPAGTYGTTVWLSSDGAIRASESGGDPLFP